MRDREDCYGPIEWAQWVDRESEHEGNYAPFFLQKLSGWSGKIRHLEVEEEKPRQTWLTRVYLESDDQMEVVVK